jgi:hypothetical protein
MVLRALQAPGDTPLIASVILYSRRQSWLLDPSSESLVQQYAVWSHLGHVAQRYPDGLRAWYLEIGASLSKIPTWTHLISQDLSSWIGIFADPGWGRRSYLGDFSAVIRDVWVPHWVEDQEFADGVEETWALAIAALSDVWGKIDFPSTPWDECIRLACCTVSTSLRRTYWNRDTFSLCSAHW